MNTLRFKANGHEVGHERNLLLYSSKERKNK